MMKVNVQTQCAGSPCVPHIQVYIMARSLISRVVRGGFTPTSCLRTKIKNAFQILSEAIKLQLRIYVETSRASESGRLLQDRPSLKL